ncbi:hypothetical protein AB0H58_32525 [Nocardia neocaledoniensis]|uniref:hypothetical protein n=1 Tax=Nocardia neocaledoniensis TaxID=236511 RepID=UPI0033E5C7D8
MGEYFCPVLLSDDSDQAVGHLRPSGAKIDEHGWIGHPFMAAIETILATPTRLAWVSDSNDTGLIGPDVIATTLLPEPDPATTGEHRFLVNLDHKVYVDKDDVPINSVGDRIHPLPLLTVDQRIRTTRRTKDGGKVDRWFGDLSLIGSWSRQRITVADVAPEGFERIEFDLIENLAT